MNARPDAVRPFWRRAAPAPRGIDAAARWLRRTTLPHYPTPDPRIGAEYELLALDAGSLRPAAWADGAGPLARWLAEHARTRGWAPDDSRKGAPKWQLPGGGALTLEPGGQVEYATAPFQDVEQLIHDLRTEVELLHESAARFGITLRAHGVDPYNPLAHAPLQFHSDRYARMAAHFARIGDAGARMMRQTASVQVNIDAGTDPDLTWRTANALAPYLVALFANSPTYAGAPTGAASYRARLWRELDPARTGLLPGREDPAREYARFSLDAPALLLDGSPFGARRRSHAEWEDHLTTLFPEVRPRGYLELRSIDSVALDRAAAALRMIAGLLWHPEAFRTVAELIGSPDEALLTRAGEVGLKDETLRLRAERLLDLGVSAAAELSGARCAAPARPRR